MIEIGKKIEYAVLLWCDWDGDNPPEVKQSWHFKTEAAARRKAQEIIKKGFGFVTVDKMYLEYDAAIGDYVMQSWEPLEIVEGGE